MRQQFNPAGLRQILQEHAQIEHLMLVGHESDLSTVATEVIGGGRIELARGGIIRITINSTESLQGKLMWLLSPDLMNA